MKTRKQPWIIAGIAEITGGLLLYFSGVFVHWGSRKESVMITGHGYTIKA